MSGAQLWAASLVNQSWGVSSINNSCLTEFSVRVICGATPGPQYVFILWAYRNGLEPWTLDIDALVENDLTVLRCKLYVDRLRLLPVFAY